MQILKCWIYQRTKITCILECINPVTGTFNGSLSLELVFYGRRIANKAIVFKKKKSCAQLQTC